MLSFPRKKTEREITKQAKNITTVSPDRFQEEFIKMFTKSTVPSKGIKLMIKTGLLKHIFRGINDIDYTTIDKLDKAAFPAFLLTYSFSYRTPLPL